ncbi:MAG: MFS transporter [Burkholderiaceae bacterium]
MFYGWWIVTACLVFATVCWSLGTFGMSVYVFAPTELQRFPITVASSAVTLAYVVSALMMVPVGRLVSRHGPRTVVATGAVLLAAGAAAMPVCRQAWQLYPVFLLLGLGMGCLSTNTIGTTLAPWFERHQGRASPTASIRATSAAPCCCWRPPRWSASRCCPVRRR